jgi:hypothetical protein
VGPVALIGLSSVVRCDIHRGNRPDEINAALSHRHNVVAGDIAAIDDHLFRRFVQRLLDAIDRRRQLPVIAAAFVTASANSFRNELGRRLPDGRARSERLGIEGEL